MDIALLKPDILAPGDGKSAGLSPSKFDWSWIRSSEDPHFEMGYATLWQEFGAAHEMETRDVVAARLAGKHGLRYEILVVRSDGALVAVRDHTAIATDGEIIVHLSHLFIAPAWRRSGIAGWMRASPILTAREIAPAAGTPSPAITLAGEMEFDDRSDPRKALRLLAYERAGFLKIDPRAVPYHQPDFRTPAAIDAGAGTKPLPFQLIIRRVGLESRRSISGREVRRIVRALYQMYSSQFRPQDMAHPALNLERYPTDDAEIALVPPTA
jgi:GNAT superfamily N-acetyltransferase